MIPDQYRAQTMTVEQAVKHLGFAHAMHVVANDELDGRISGAWTANNLKSMAAYSALKHAVTEDVPFEVAS